MSAIPHFVRMGHESPWERRTQLLNAILLLGVTLLLFGTAGLVLVRLSNPRLRGLGSLGGAFASGGTGALLLLLNHRVPDFLSGPCSDVAVLLAFVLLHRAVLDLLEEAPGLPRFGLILLGMEALAHVATFTLHSSGRVRVAVLGCLVTMQCLQTALLLIRRSRYGIRASMWFNAGILISFGVLNLIRSGAMLIGSLRASVLSPIETATFLAYIAAALGLAFGFFWMTTAELSAELEYMASTDPLTRVYNRRVFRDWCEKELARTYRSGTTFSILVIDVDHFKRINDRFGHRAGDLVLCAVVEQMQDSVRGIDVLGRWGGEEFVALLPGAGEEAALIVAHRVRRNVEKLRLARILCDGGYPIDADGLTVSVGMASHRGETDRIEDMLDRADCALYRAKAEGRNRVLSAC